MHRIYMPSGWLASKELSPIQTQCQQKPKNKGPGVLTGTNTCQGLFSLLAMPLLEPASTKADSLTIKLGVRKITLAFPS